MMAQDAIVVDGLWMMSSIIKMSSSLSDANVLSTSLWLKMRLNRS